MVPQFFIALATTLQLWLGGMVAAPTRVAQVARNHGFAHPGRVATFYRSVYGEPPSSALART